MVAGKPVSLTQVSAEDYDGPAPKPLKVVGSIPGTASEISPQTAPTIDDSPADAAAVAADLQSVVDALVAAGVFTEA
jgi:hypothetical protein